MGVGTSSGVAVSERAEGSTPTLTPAELLGEMLTPELALKLVELEVRRKEQFERQKEDLLAPHEVDGATVIASNVLKPESLKRLDLRGGDASETYVVVEDGQKIQLADFIISLKDNPEGLKTALQGLAYNADSKFTGNVVDNKRVLAILNNDKVSSKYNGNGSELTQVKDLIEPAMTRFAALLNPSVQVTSRAGEVGELGITQENTDRFVGGDGSADVGAGSNTTSSTESQSGTKGAVSGGGLEEANEGDTSASQGQSERTRALQEIHDWGNDEQQLEEFRRRSAKQRLELIEALVGTESGEETEGTVIQKAKEKAIALVKGWIGKEIESRGFIVETVDNTSSSAERDTKDGCVGGTEEEGSQQSLEGENSCEFGAIAESNINLSDLLTQFRSSLSDIQSFDAAISNKGMFIGKISSDNLVILPQLGALKRGEIDSDLLQKYYDIRPGEIGPGWGISELSEVELNVKVPKKITVKTKGTLYLPADHKYFADQNSDK